MNLSPLESTERSLSDKVTVSGTHRTKADGGEKVSELEVGG